MSQEIPIRKIIHVDMDAFYASVEQMDNPDLAGKPLAVGGSAQRGVVAAASYEARKYGVKSAMPSVTAARKCPHLIFVKPRFARYRELSQQIREIFFDYSDLVEPLSLDEAFIDVTENKKNLPSATLIAKEIRDRIYNEVGLRASAGISINKFIAKVASDINKPNGQKTIPPEEVLEFLERLPIKKFFGVGKVTAEKMKRLGIFNGANLKQHSQEYLIKRFGKSGIHFYNIVRGIQHSPVKPDRTRKSVGAERTFHEDLSERDLILEKLRLIAEEVNNRLTKSEIKGKTVTLKIKYNDFTQQTRSKTVPFYIASKDEILNQVHLLLEQEELSKPIRLLGISMSNLNNSDRETENLQMTLSF